MDIISDHIPAIPGPVEQYISPAVRARRLADAIIAESVNGTYTAAENALFMLDVAGQVCAAFAEHHKRCRILRALTDVDYAPPGRRPS